MNAPPSPPAVPASALQARLFAFAIDELVRQNRASFQPLWSAESWAKLLIWLALNCGCSGEREDLERFAAALGPLHTTRLRQLFFSRDLEELGLRLLADPAEAEALALAEDPQTPLDRERLRQALERQGLLPLLADPEQWRPADDGVLRLPWRLRRQASPQHLNPPPCS
jgi:hypothetical protein